MAVGFVTAAAVGLGTSVPGGVLVEGLGSASADGVDVEIATGGGMPSRAEQPTVKIVINTIITCLIDTTRRRNRRAVLPALL